MPTLKYLDTATGTYKPIYIPAIAVGGGLAGDGSSAAPLRLGHPAIPSGADLNSYINPGQYIQASNSVAASGTNYPGPVTGLAGMLEVGAEDKVAGMVWQRYTSYKAGSLSVAVLTYQRAFYNGTWSPWLLHGGGDTGWQDMTGWASGWTASGGLGGPSMWQARQIGNKVELRGNILNSTFTGTNVTICTLNAGIDPPLQTTGFTIVGSSIMRWGSVLATGAVQVTCGTAAGGSWYQIIGSYLTD